MEDLHGVPATVSLGAAYKEGYGTRPYLVIVHAIHDDGSRLVASLDISSDLGEVLVVTLNGQEVGRAHGYNVFGLMNRYGIAQEFPAGIRKEIMVDWACHVGLNPREIAWWR